MPELSGHEIGVPVLVIRGGMHLAEFYTKHPQFYKQSRGTMQRVKDRAGGRCFSYDFPFMKKFLPLIPLGALVAAFALAQTNPPPRPEARRIEVLFLGAPTAHHPGHDPIQRYRVIKKHLGAAGIDFTYTEDLGDLRREVLDRYDALMFYGNWDQGGPMNPEQEKALIGYVEDGGGFLPIHCASACFGGSDAYIKLVGGRFKWHGDGVFRTTITAPDHPIMRGFEGFETWDETYVHDRHGDDRTILQKREDEPWTWVRTQGKGKVFYTAYGHDMRCWGQPGFHELLRRAVMWSVGAEVRSKWMALKLPELEQEEMLLPGYLERKAITSGQKPLPPEESNKMANVPMGFELSLFASEPDIVNPIFVTWDHRGRAYVVETVDYPNNLQAGNIGNDRITLCEDTNGDGRADKFTVFADKLSIPTSAVFANGGLICTNGSEILFLRDTNGDDKADERRVLFRGFSMGDTHAGPSNLRHGPDNWIYATVGYSGFDGEVGGERIRFNKGVFRFKPDGSKLEFLQSTTNNTWGLGFTPDFDLMGSTANANPSWYFTFPESMYRRAGMEPAVTPRADDNPLFFPSSTDIRQVDVHGGYTAAAGHAFYTSDRFPPSWRDGRIAFVTEPTGKLVGQFEITREGAGFKARQLPNNLFDSADAWSSPVFAETGPDGAVWICDWYNLIIQHNPTPSVASAGVDAKNGRGNAYETPLRDTRHGRIYRVYPSGTADDKNPGLDPADPGTLIAALEHPNQFWRIEAQRLLVETRSATATAKLREIVNSGSAYAALHAFGALQGLGALDDSTVRAALGSPHRGLRRVAIAEPMAVPFLAATFTRDGVLATADDREMAELLAASSRQAASEETGRLLFATLSKLNAADPVLMDAWQIAASSHVQGVLLAAAQAGGEINPLLGKLAGHFAEKGDPTAKSALATALAGRTDPFSRDLLAKLNAAPVEKKEIVRKHTPDPAVHERGLVVYNKTCVACHGPEGKGVPMAFPPLDGSERLTGDPTVPTRIVLHGLHGPLEAGGAKFNTVMAPLNILTDAEIADVLTYARQTWSNDAAAVKAEEVTKVRAQYAGRDKPWTAEELE